MDAYGSENRATLLTGRTTERHCRSVLRTDSEPGVKSRPISLPLRTDIAGHRSAQFRLKAVHQTAQPLDAFSFPYPNEQHYSKEDATVLQALFKSQVLNQNENLSSPFNHRSLSRNRPISMSPHRLAWIALFSLILLVFVGATVRVTGSGLGCPDWPTCWGCLIPPTSSDQIDVSKLDMAKFKRHAAKKGIDPDTITRETVLASFDPVHTWIEFFNRLTSLPLGFATLLLAFVSFWAKRHKWWVVGLSWFCLADVIGNAIMGAVVVSSGLQPGIITLHMALAFLLIAVLVTIIWLTRSEGGRVEIDSGYRKKILIASLIFFTCLFCEGLMGSQLREQTDQLAKASAGMDRSDWIEQLDATLIYKVHRSFSWTLLVTSGLVLFWMRKAKAVKCAEPKWIFAMVIAMMLMGIVLAHVAILQVVQVLHVGCTAVLLGITWHWILRLFGSRVTASVS